MTISRMQQQRQQYGLGSLVKSLGRGVKKIGKGIKKFAKSDVGKMAITAALMGAPFGGGAWFGPGSGFGAAKSGIAGLFTQGGVHPGTEGPLSGITSAWKGMGDFGKTAAVFGGGSLIGALMNKAESGDEDAIGLMRNKDALRSYLDQGYRNLKSFQKDDGSVDEVALNQQITVDMSEYKSDGGRVGYSSGSGNDDKEGVVELEMSIADRWEKIKELMKKMEEIKSGKTTAPDKKAKGGRIGLYGGSGDPVQAAGLMGLPTRTNKAGVNELDLRDSGGFIPPVGIKEKADDVPAMLSNNEFVMTADAVKAAGGGSVEKGAQRMYDTMKRLEGKVA